MSKQARCLLYLSFNSLLNSLYEDFLEVLIFHKNNKKIDITDVTSNFYLGTSNYYNKSLQAKGFKFIPFSKINLNDYDYVVMYYGMSRIKTVIEKENIIRSHVGGSLDSGISKKFSYSNNPQIIHVSNNAYTEAAYYGIDEKKIIPCTILCNADFSIETFEKIRNNPPSIIANNCFGRYTSFVLGTQFNSPFVNITLAPKAHLKVLKKLRSFMNARLSFAGMRDIYCRGREEIETGESANTEDGTKLVPTAYLETADDRVLIYCNHYKTFEEFDFVWNRRKDRINYGNVIAVLTTEDPQDAEEFAKLTMPKLCFLQDNRNQDLIDARDIGKGIIRVNYNIYAQFNNSYYPDCPEDFSKYDFFKISNHTGMRLLPFYNLLDFLATGQLVLTENFGRDIAISKYLTKVIFG